MSTAPDLAQLQGWMVDALCGTEGGPVLDAGEVLLPSPTMSPHERLDLYRRSYLIRLLDCLREMHPALRHLLGDELFDAFALDYLAARPPTSYTLFDLDAGFADHLAATRPDEGPAAEPWPELLIDVVRFERAFLEVYDGPGVEGQAVPTAEDVRKAAAAAAGVVVSPAPCARLLRSRYPVGDYVLAVRRDGRADVPLPAPTCLALVRRNYVVTLVPVADRSYDALAALFAGASSIQAAPVGGTDHGTVLRWIAAWADQGLFATIA